MSFYKIGKASVAAATGAAYATVHGSTADLAEILQYGYFCNAATASSVETARPANTPTASTSTLLNAFNADAVPASVVNFDTAWSTAPTTPTIIYDLITLPATIGAGYMYGPVPIGMGIQLSKTAGSHQWVVFWNFGGSTGSVLNTTVMDSE